MTTGMHTTKTNKTKHNKTENKKEETKLEKTTNKQMFPNIPNSRENIYMWIHSFFMLCFHDKGCLHSFNFIYQW